jgi:hypothetical protein
LLDTQLAGTFKNAGAFLKGDAAMLQVFGQIMFVGLFIGVVGAIWMIILDRY